MNVLLECLLWMQAFSFCYSYRLLEHWDNLHHDSASTKQLEYSIKILHYPPLAQRNTFPCHNSHNLHVVEDILLSNVLPF